MVDQVELVVVGDIAWDILIRPEDEFVWGTDVYGAVKLSPGGSAANVAVWARRLGARVTLAGKIGDDALGALMRASLDREDVTRGVEVVRGGATTRVAALVSPHGERAFVTDKDSVLGFDPGDLDPALLDGADLVFVTGYAVFSSASAAFLTPFLDEARRRGVRIAFDPSSFDLVASYGAARLLREVGPVDFLMVNEAEAATLHPAAPQALLDATRAVVVKRGANGASVFTRDVNRSAVAPRIEVVDTTGAGDAFDAAFLVEFLRSGDADAALAAGNRIGAFVARHLGAQPALTEDA
jgi:ribokinase